jgi:hypothetical protein
MTDSPTPIVIEGRVHIDYFDDGGTNMGVYIEADGNPIGIVVRHSIPEGDYDPDHEYQWEDHPVAVLMGRRCRVTIEILDEEPQL